MITHPSSDYLTNIDWFKNVLNEDVILCHTSALECLSLFSGYMNESEIDVYSKAKGKYDNINYRVINDFEDIQITNISGILCTSVEQTINDMLSDFDETDEQALLEALNRYYFLNNCTFKNLIIRKENVAKFNLIKDFAISYHEEE